MRVNTMKAAHLMGPQDLLADEVYSPVADMCEFGGHGEHPVALMEPR